MDMIMRGLDLLGEIVESLWNLRFYRENLEYVELMRRADELRERFDNVLDRVMMYIEFAYGEGEIDASTREGFLMRLNDINSRFKSYYRDLLY